MAEPSGKIKQVSHKKEKKVKEDNIENPSSAYISGCVQTGSEHGGKQTIGKSRHQQRAGERKTPRGLPCRFPEERKYSEDKQKPGPVKPYFRNILDAVIKGQQDRFYDAGTIQHLRLPYGIAGSQDVKEKGGKKKDQRNRQKPCLFFLPENQKKEEHGQEKDGGDQGCNVIASAHKNGSETDQEKTYRSLQAGMEKMSP